MKPPSPPFAVAPPSQSTSVSAATVARLFVVGSTVGPIVDSLHNQCLLEYNVLPIKIPDLTVRSLPTSTAENGSISTVIGTAGIGSNNVVGDQQVIQQHWSFLHSPSQLHYDYIFTSSWTVLPLLGFAYVVLGVLLPRAIVYLFSVRPRRLHDEDDLRTADADDTYDASCLDSDIDTDTVLLTLQNEQQQRQRQEQELRRKAIVAVTTTAMIIKLSELLETGTLQIPAISSSSLISPEFIVLITSALMQWFWLDRTAVSLIAASITSIGGPLSELPFVGHGIWTYLDPAGDYYPLQHLEIITSLPQSWCITLFGTSEYENLALSSLTGPCYFAVCMDAIALGRYFDSLHELENNSNGGWK